VKEIISFKEQTMDREKQEKIAIFRFGVIFPLVEKDLHEYWGEKERILRELVSKEWEIPFSDRTYISKATILNWIKRYEDGGRKIEALFPESRGDRGRMRSISDEQIDALMRLRNENPKLSTPRLVEKARSEGVFPPGNEVSMASIYRLLKIRKAKRQKAVEDMRKFEVQMANDLWQSDCMHGPSILSGGKKRKTYLFAIIDDHSRLITHGQFYLAENLENYLDCLWTAMRKRGVPRKLYVDNGPSFRAHRLQLGCASLEVGLSYAKPYRPQGKGYVATNIMWSWAK
jgi:putative transposase